jgi:uncharacterized phage protein (TIGR01671 family)
MKRTIKFRGKSIDNGEWVYGDLNQIFVPEGSTEDCPSISDKFDGTFFVHPNSVGQFTGIVDKDNEQIYEGDILQCLSVPNIPLEVRYNTMQGAFCLVEHTHTEGALLGTCPLGEMLRHYPDMRVIGTRFDSPSLISDKQ